MGPGGFPGAIYIPYSPFKGVYIGPIVSQEGSMIVYLTLTDAFTLIGVCSVCVHVISFSGGSLYWCTPLFAKADAMRFCCAKTSREREGRNCWKNTAPMAPRKGPK